MRLGLETGTKLYALAVRLPATDGRGSRAAGEVMQAPG